MIEFGYLVANVLIIDLRPEVRQTHTHQPPTTVVLPPRRPTLGGGVTRRVIVSNRPPLALEAVARGRATTTDGRTGGRAGGRAGGRTRGRTDARADARAGGHASEAERNGTPRDKSRLRENGTTARAPKALAAVGDPLPFFAGGGLAAARAGD